MKALVGENDDRILGFTMIGATAGEVMAAVQTAMIAGLPYSRLANAALAHPTMAEGLSMLFSNAPPRSVQQIAPERAEFRVLHRTPCGVRVANNRPSSEWCDSSPADQLIASGCEG